MSSPLGADSLLLPLRGGHCFPPWNLSRLGVRLDHGVLSTQYHVPRAGFQLRMEKREGDGAWGGSRTGSWAERRNDM